MNIFCKIFGHKLRLINFNTVIIDCCARNGCTFGEREKTLGIATEAESMPGIDKDNPIGDDAMAQFRHKLLSSGRVNSRDIDSVVAEYAHLFSAWGAELSGKMNSSIGGNTENN